MDTELHTPSGAGMTCDSQLNRKMRSDFASQTVLSDFESTVLDAQFLMNAIKTRSRETHLKRGRSSRLLLQNLTFVGRACRLLAPHARLVGTRTRMNQTPTSPSAVAPMRAGRMVKRNTLMVTARVSIETAITLALRGMPNPAR